MAAARQRAKGEQGDLARQRRLSDGRQIDGVAALDLQRAFHAHGVGGLPGIVVIERRAVRKDQAGQGVRTPGRPLNEGSKDVPVWSRIWSESTSAEPPVTESPSLPCFRSYARQLNAYWSLMKHSIIVPC